MKDFTFTGKMTGETFNSHVNEQLPFYQLVTDATGMIVRNYLPKNGFVYDIGASTGNISKTIKPFAESRNATVISIEESVSMSSTWDGYGKLYVADATDFNYEKFDVAVCFLVLMFMSLEQRANLLLELRKKMNAGGAIIIVDKLLAEGGYFGTVMRRLTFDWKLKNGASPDQIITKELSLSGVQRPMTISELPDAKEFFRFGEFVGWVIE
jgi:tRNA (cmo5U34)-methyltransferase